MGNLSFLLANLSRIGVAAAFGWALFATLNPQRADLWQSTAQEKLKPYWEPSNSSTETSEALTPVLEHSAVKSEEPPAEPEEKPSLNLVDLLTP
jgi:hypothetical protein